MLVSVLTPSFNQARWLADNLRSVENQTYSNIEHIVMDGGSSDGSVEILRQAGPSVIWQSEPDDGQSDALNKAFRRSAGEIIGWINSDDAYVDRRVVARIAEKFKAEPSTDVIYGDVLLVSEDNLVLEYFSLSWGGVIDRWIGKPSTVLRFGAPFIQPGVFLRRSALGSQFVRQDFHFTMDGELWARLARLGRSARPAGFVVGIDRHQPERKGMSEEYLAILKQELKLLDTEYDRQRGVLWNARRLTLRGTQRLLGVPRILKLEREVDPAFGLLVDSPASRLKRQTITRRAKMVTSTSGRRALETKVGV